MHDKIAIDPSYLKKFWVGLMDGDGSIQVNHWRKKCLQYRLVIKLRNCNENVSMLNLISIYIGGKVKILPNKDFVLWVVDSKKSILKIILIFNKFPPLTSRLKSQLNFMLECIERNDIEWYFNTRNSKYFLFKQYNNLDKLNAVEKIKFTNHFSSYDFYDFKSLPYFNEWLSGFTEAEGCFSIRKNNYHSFSIGQKNDKYLIDVIRSHFKIQSLTRKKNNDFWVIETYRKSTFSNIIKHFTTYPLLGEKLISFNKFKDLI